MVDIAPLIGTYSSFEVATHVADFSVAYDGGRSFEDDGGDPEAAGAYVDSNRVDEATLIRVTFVADSQEAAVKGLRDGVGEALKTVGDGLEMQRDYELRAARASYQDRLDAANERGTGFNDPSVERAGQIVADSSVAMRTLRIARASAQERVDDLPITTEPLSSMSQRLRATVVAALVGFLLAGGALLLIRRRADEHSHRAPLPWWDDARPDPP